MSEKNVKTPLESVKKAKPTTAKTVEPTVEKVTEPLPDVEPEIAEVLSLEAIEEIKAEEAAVGIIGEAGAKGEPGVAGILAEEELVVGQTATETAVVDEKKKNLAFAKELLPSEKAHYEKIITSQKETIASLREQVAKYQEGYLEKEKTSKK